MLIVDDFLSVGNALVIFTNWNPMICIAGSVAFGVIKSNLPGASNVPDAVFSMLPFVMTAMVIVVTSMRKSKKNSAPAFIGLNYFREER